MLILSSKVIDQKILSYLNGKEHFSDLVKVIQDKF